MTDSRHGADAPAIVPLPFPTSKPRLLDLFCCEGGAAMGYHRAGFEVVGVDVKKQRRYPFTFIHADALEGTTHPLDEAQRAAYGAMVDCSEPMSWTEGTEPDPAVLARIAARRTPVGEEKVHG